MNRVIVIGCPGSGKSVFSRALHEKTGLPLYHLDNLYWNADRTKVDRGVFLDRLENILISDQWIIDGNYASTMEKRMQRCDTVFFLDYPLDVCLSGVNARQGMKRPDMPWTEAEGEEDAEFLNFIKSYISESRPVVLDLLSKNCDKEIHIFTSRRLADAFLENL
ncbi:MAG: adenylate kinase [Oscillospiraceae bacterium]|nr:adenylate kinase [Oscillospiraceae bacterium]